MVCKVCIYVLVCKVFVKAMMLLIHISERASGNPNLLFSNMQLLWRNSFSSKPDLASKTDRLMKTRKISEGKKGKKNKKCSPNRMHVCWKYCRSSYSEPLIPNDTSYVQVGFHTQLLYWTLGLACIEFWVTCVCTIKIVYLLSYCCISCVLLKENSKKKHNKNNSAVSSVIILWAKFCMTQRISEDFMMLCLSLLTLTW